MIIPLPLTLHPQAEPFDGPDWLYEIKHDGFRALAVIEHQTCRLLFRQRQELYGFRNLRSASPAKSALRRR
ncbi:MAG: hypothetical protein ACREJN_04680 [Nitrospiraceae bacterium]